NLDAAMAVPLPLGQADPVTRLRRIAADTKRRKSQVRSAAVANLLGAPAFQKIVLRYLNRQRLVNVYVADVAGPARPLYLAGARLREVFAVVPIIGNVTLGVGALSYAGQLNLTVIADERSCGDVAVFVDGLRRALAELTQRLAPTPTAKPTPTPTPARSRPR